MDDDSLADLMAGVLGKDRAVVKQAMEGDDVPWDKLGGQQYVEQAVNKFAQELINMKENLAKFNGDETSARRNSQAKPGGGEPTTVAAWQQEGKKNFTAKQFTAAMRCYYNALLLMQHSKQQQQQQQQALHDQGQLLLSVLLNLSATTLKLQQPQQALVYAAAAVAYSCDRSSKAYYRLAIALDKLDETDTAASSSSSSSGRSMPLASSAVIIMTRAQKLLPPSATPQSKADMMSQLQSGIAKGKVGSSRSSGSSSANDGDVGQAWLVVLGHLAEALQVMMSRTIPDTGNGRLASSSSSSSNSSGRDAADSGDPRNAATHKDQGNSAFKEGNYSQALQHYQASFKALQSSSSSSSAASTASVLLSNKAACHLQLGSQNNLIQAVIDAVAAVVLCNAQMKAYYRAANALLQLNLLSQAAAVCQLGLVNFPEDVSLQQLKQQIATGAAAGSKSKKAANSTGGSSSKASSSSSGGHSGKHMSEREFIALQRQGKASAGVMAMVNRLSQMAAATGKDMSQILDTRIPPFHEEYHKANRRLREVDTQAVFNKLWEGYEAARSQPTSMLGLQRHSSVFNVETMRMRLSGPDDKEGLEWLCTAPFGTVRWSRRGPYMGGYQSFSNTTAKAEILALDTTHVSIGFVDLGGLAASCSLMTENLQCDAADSEGWRRLTAAAGGPLRWVGYEMSAYAVAKALVLLEMIEQNASDDNLLQAWYSAAWSDSTLKAFKSALTAVLTKQQQQQQQAAVVLQILCHWQTHEVSLSNSRNLWLSFQALTLTFIANFNRKADRVALCEYITTGQLLTGADVGNVMMFEVPQGHKERTFDESILQTLPSIPLLQQVASGGARGPDIVSVATGMLRQQIISLKGLLRAGAVTAEVCYGAVNPSSSIITAIHSLQPYSITWSNVPDYIDPQAFHKLARAVSADKDTVHYMHTMNWIKDVKGCSHVDLMLSMPEEELPKRMPQVRDASNKAASDLYKGQKLDKLMLLPPVDTIRNIIDWSLCLAHCRGWVEAFFDPKLSGMKDRQRQVQRVGPPEYSVCSSSNTTMHITFTYDEDINFTKIKHKM